MIAVNREDWDSNIDVRVFIVDFIELTVQDTTSAIFNFFSQHLYFGSSASLTQQRPL